MRNLKLEIDIQEYSSIDELDAVDRKLVEAAIEAQKGSYAPYSSFNVGAAVLLEDGTVVKGSRILNSGGDSSAKPSTWSTISPSLRRMSVNISVKSESASSRI